MACDYYSLWPADICRDQEHQSNRCVHLLSTIPVGQEFRLEIQPPNRQSIIVSARPIWAIETGSPEISYRFVFGVQFEYIAEEDIQFLGDIVANQKSVREINEA